MTILLDFSLVAPGGATTYANSFLDALADRSDLDDIAVLLGSGTDDLSDVADRLRTAGCRVVISKLGTGYLGAVRRQALVPMVALRLRAGVVFCPRETAPLLTPGHLVVLANNLKAWPPDISTTSTERLRWLARTAVAHLVVLRAARVLAVSAVMAGALPRKVRRKVTVVHHGCDLRSATETTSSNASRPPAVRIVALGSISPHKRFDRLVDAVALLRKVGTPADLIIWGADGDPAHAASLRGHAVETLGSDPFHGAAPPVERQAILENADVLAVSGTFESFGFPLVEGMRTSCLVWTPRSALVEELCGRIAVTYSDGDLQEAVQSLREALTDRSVRLAEGRLRSERYTWAATVERTISALRRASARRHKHHP